MIAERTDLDGIVREFLKVGRENGKFRLYLLLLVAGRRSWIVAAGQLVEDAVAADDAVVPVRPRRLPRDPQTENRRRPSGKISKYFPCIFSRHHRPAPTSYRFNSAYVFL